MSRQKYFKYPVYIIIFSILIAIGWIYTLDTLLHGFFYESILHILLVVAPVAILSWVILSFPTVKRLHDINFSGWFYLLLLIDPIYEIFCKIYLNSKMILEIEIILVVLLVSVFLILFFKKGTKGANKYGPDPLETTNK